MLPPMADLSGAYAEARGRLVELLEGLDESRLATRVPACPDWTVRDVLAHVTGVAADAAQERFFLGATDAWRGGDLGEERDAPITRLGLRIYARWLGQRLDQTGRPALLLRTGDREWVEGAGAPEAVLAAEPFELFRALSGRRSAAQVRALAWDGEPERYLEVFAPYPMPSSPLRE